MVFLQNNFELNPELLLAEMKALPSNSAAFSSLALAKDKVVALKDLRTVDLESVSQNELSAYVFLFDSDLLRLLTPLNFAYFNRFVLEEMIILPIAALLQKTERLRCITALLHGYETALVQFKEFVLEPRPALKDHLCFVSYPSDPYALRAAEFAAFADSLAAISGS